MYTLQSHYNEQVIVYIRFIFNLILTICLSADKSITNFVEYSILLFNFGEYKVFYIAASIINCIQYV